MQGDFTRIRFNERDHYSRVMLQQGRVQLDADFNELNAILLHRIETLARDLIGPFGGPAKWDEAKVKYVAGDGFDIVNYGDSKQNFAIRPGRYYVNGILCENDALNGSGLPVDMPYSKQADYPLANSKDDPILNKVKPGQYLVYLDVWERHITYLEMENDQGEKISIRESALMGPDTATRAQVVWQVKVDKTNQSKDEIMKDWDNWVQSRQPERRGMLKARARQPEGPDMENPCITPPESRYRGVENQLYRVEIHRGGNADQATFKWSRENASVIFPIDTVEGKVITLKTLGRDPRFGLHPNDWVEVIDDTYTLHNRVEALIQVDSIDYDANMVTLKEAPAVEVGRTPGSHPILRRWDQCESEWVKPNAMGITIKEGSSETDWIELEDGVQVQFQKVDATEYRTGDYWLIPARTATGDVEWPGKALQPAALPPAGIEHHYAPLRLILLEADGTVTLLDDMRRHFAPRLVA